MTALVLAALISGAAASGPATARRAFPPPSGVVSVSLGNTSERLWPYTGTDFSGSPQDPLNLFFTGDADPRIVRQTLLALDGNRTAFGLPDVFPFNCTWTDAIGRHQTAWAAAAGWQGSAIQLQCGEYATLRTHLRLFREGGHTLGNAHFEVLIPGTTDHEVLAWEFAQLLVEVDLARSGALTAPPAETPVLTPAPTYRAIRHQVFNGLLPVLGPLLPLLGLPATPQSAPIPIPNDGKASILQLYGAVAQGSSDALVRFDHPFDQTIPKPFCSTGPLDFLKVRGSLRMEHRVRTNPSGRLWATFEADGVLEVTPVDPRTGEPTGPTYPAVVSETHRSSLSDRRSQAHHLVLQTLLSRPLEAHLETLSAGDLDHHLRVDECGP